MHVKIPASENNAWVNNLNAWFAGKAPGFIKVIKLLAPVNKEGDKLGLVFKDNPPLKRPRHAHRQAQST